MAVVDAVMDQLVSRVCGIIRNLNFVQHIVVYSAIGSLLRRQKAGWNPAQVGFQLDEFFDATLNFGIVFVLKKLE